MKTLLLLVLLTLGVSTQAQYIKYEPIPIVTSSSYTMALPAPPAVNYSTPAYSTPVTSQTVIGYCLSKDDMIAVKLNLVTVNGKTYAASYKNQSETVWRDLTTKIPLSRLNEMDRLSKAFEYKVYIPALLRDVYIQ